MCGWRVVAEWPEPQDTGALVLASMRDWCPEEKIWARCDNGLWVCLCGCNTQKPWSQLEVIGEAIPPLRRDLWRRRTGD